MVLSEKHGVYVWDLTGLKDIFQMLEQLLILSRSAEREAAAACLKDEKLYGRRRNISKDI